MDREAYAQTSNQNQTRHARRGHPPASPGPFFDLKGKRGDDTPLHFAAHAFEDPRERVDLMHLTPLEFETAVEGGALLAAPVVPAAAAAVNYEALK